MESRRSISFLNVFGMEDFMGKKAVKTGRMGQVAVGENFRTVKKNKKG